MEQSRQRTREETMVIITKKQCKKCKLLMGIQVTKCPRCGSYMIKEVVADGVTPKKVFPHPLQVQDAPTSFVKTQEDEK